MRIFFLLFFFLSQNFANASVVSQIISNFNSTQSMKFNFVQTIDGKIEKGKCTLVYPKKIFCEYIDFYNKILVSNGKSLLINSDKNNQYFRYPLEKTPLNLILDKDFLINKIKNLSGRIVNDKFINYTFIENQNEINIFFNKDNYNLIGWQTLDIYQNLSITYIDIIFTNQKLKKNLFKLPNQD